MKSGEVVGDCQLRLYIFSFVSLFYILFSFLFFTRALRAAEAGTFCILPCRGFLRLWLGWETRRFLLFSFLFFSFLFFYFYFFRDTVTVCNRLVFFCDRKELIWTERNFIEVYCHLLTLL